MQYDTQFFYRERKKQKIQNKIFTVVIWVGMYYGQLLFSSLDIFIL